MMDPIALAKHVHRPSGATYEICKAGPGIYTVQQVPDGPYVANAYVVDKEDGTSGDYLTSVIVEKPHRRRGIAEALYKAIERDLGYPLRPSPRHLSPDAEAFWKNRKRYK